MAGKRPHRYKHWTGPRMAAFLRALAASRSVAAAARSVGMGRQSAYKLRQRLAGMPFDFAWDMALAAPPGALARNPVSPCRPVAFSVSELWKHEEFEGDTPGHGV